MAGARGSPLTAAGSLLRAIGSLDRRAQYAGVTKGVIQMIELGCLEEVPGTKADHDLVLFALSTCGWCKKARTFLDGNDIAYRYVYLDLLEGEEQRTVLGEAARWNAKRTFPTLIIDEEDVIVGFDDSSYAEKLL
jgi:glutaredoxin